jgi:SAM-dependent methyltransferase
MDHAAFHDFEHAGWERAADAYAAALARLTGQAIAPLLDVLAVGPGTRLLDLASGPGDLAAAAAARGATACAIDFSPAMIALGRRRHPGVDFRQGDVTALPLPDAGADAAAMAYGLLHLARPEAALAEGFRVLRPGGRFAATVWAPPGRARGFALILDAVRAHGRAEVGLPPGPPFFRFSDPEVFAAALTAAGFAEVAVTAVDQRWILAGADEFFAAMCAGTVRTGALLMAQDNDARARIRAAVAAACAPFMDGGRLVLPMPAVMACGRRP